MIRSRPPFANTVAAAALAVVLGVSASVGTVAAGPPSTRLPVSGGLLGLSLDRVAPSSDVVLSSASLPASAWSSPAPAPRLDSVPQATAAAVTASFFGPGVTVKTYTVTGATPMAIYNSVRARGPYSPWLGGRADAITASKMSYQFSLRSSLVEVTPGTWSGACQVRQDASPAITQTYTVLLPRWTPPRGASRETIRWWADRLLKIATHERTHVQIGIKATRAANVALTSSTCANAESRLNAIWLDEQLHNCEFDMREYGKASGLTLKSCTSQ